MPQNEHLVAKIGFDTAENELSKVWQVLPNCSGSQPGITSLNLALCGNASCSFSFCWLLSRNTSPAINSSLFDVERIDFDGREDRLRGGKPPSQSSFELFYILLPLGKLPQVLKNM